MTFVHGSHETISRLETEIEEKMRGYLSNEYRSDVRAAAGQAACGAA